MTSKITLSDGRLLVFKQIYDHGPYGWELQNSDGDSIRILTCYESEFIEATMNELYAKYGYDGVVNETWVTPSGIVRGTVDFTKPVPIGTKVRIC